MKEIFTNLVMNRQWDPNVPCGSGSSFDYTRLLRTTLPEFLNKHNISSMLDAPCGDHSWMSLIEFPTEFVYIGGDIVDPMIEQNRVQWPSKDFRVLDLTQDSLPKVDLLFCRDCLFHLSEADLVKVFDNILSSSVKYVMTTSYIPGNDNNSNIQTGGFRPINLRKPPFNLPRPIDSLDDGPVNQVIRQMCLWNKNDFSQALK